jgi:hypothetical protein
MRLGRPLFHGGAVAHRVGRRLACRFSEMRPASDLDPAGRRRACPSRPDRRNRDRKCNEGRKNGAWPDQCACLLAGQDGMDGGRSTQIPVIARWVAVGNLRLNPLWLLMDPNRISARSGGCRLHQIVKLGGSQPRLDVKLSQEARRETPLRRTVARSCECLECRSRSSSSPSSAARQNRDEPASQ